MFFSIITVNYNSGNQLQKTIASVMAQTFQDYEYLIIDGASTDTSLHTAEYAAKKEARIRLYSSPDKGIYDAMNKGSRLSRGNYIFFLNAGDIFYSPDVLLRVSRRISGVLADIYYGAVKKEALELPPRAINNCYFFRERTICHQAVFAARPTLLRYPFHCEYQYGADRDWLIASYRAGAVFSAIPVTTVRYDTTGLTSRPENTRAVWEESLCILKKYYGPSVLLVSRLKWIIMKRLLKLPYGY